MWKINLIIPIYAYKDISLVVNTGKIKYMEVWCMMANKHIRIGNNSYEKVKTFTYLGSLLTNQNCIQEEIQRRIKTES